MGIHLGLYRALADAPASAVELAERTGCDERYMLEWLQSQAIGGLLAVDGTDPATARFTLAEGVYDVLVDETGPAYLGGLADIVAAAGHVLPQLASAYRTGAGVPYAAYGPEGVSAQAALNRPAFVNSLVAEWLPQLPDVLGRLQDTGNPARVADLACGTGWAAIELAKAFPHVTVDGRGQRRLQLCYRADPHGGRRLDLPLAASLKAGGGERAGKARYSPGSGCKQPAPPLPRRTPAPGSAHCPSRLRKAYLGGRGVRGRRLRLHLASAPRTGHGKDPSNHRFQFSSTFHAGALLGRQRMMKSQAKGVQLRWISN